MNNKLEQAINVLKRYEQWEANLIMDDSSWEGDLPTLTSDRYDELMEITGASK